MQTLEQAEMEVMHQNNSMSAPAETNKPASITEKITDLMASTAKQIKYLPIITALSGVGIAYYNNNKKMPSSKQIAIFASIGFLVGIIPMAVKYYKLNKI